MRFGSFYFIMRYPFIFVSRHAILHELCQDICEGLVNESFSKQDLVWVFCGAHMSFSFLRYLPGAHLYIQTEQLTDLSGRTLWGAHKKKISKNIKKNIKNSTIFLDININNRSYYSHLELEKQNKKKVVLGPHIFPRKRVPFASSAEGQLIFFGSLNKRRMSVLNEIQNLTKRIVRVIPEKTYGQSLKSEIKGSSGVINIHYDEGTYTEAPRILSVYLQGKPFISEDLAPPFVKNVHYIGLNGTNDLNSEEIFRKFSHLVSTQLSFKSFISTHFRRD